MKLKQIVIFFILLIVITPGINAQDQVTSPVTPETVAENPDSQTSVDQPETVPEKNVEKPRTITAPAAAPSQDTSRAKKPAANVEPEQPGDTTGLIGTTDGDFRYERIPGITIKKPASVSEPAAADQTVPGTGGISALNSDTKNNLIRGGIVLLIFILFIFYRSRSGRRRRRY